MKNIFGEIKNSSIDNIVIHNLYKRDNIKSCCETRYGYVGCGFTINFKTKKHSTYIPHSEKSEDIKLSVKKKFDYTETNININ